MPSTCAFNPRCRNSSANQTFSVCSCSVVVNFSMVRVSEIEAARPGWDATLRGALARFGRGERRAAAEPWRTRLYPAASAAALYSLACATISTPTIPLNASVRRFTVGPTRPSPTGSVLNLVTGRMNMDVLDTNASSAP